MKRYIAATFWQLMVFSITLWGALRLWAAWHGWAWLKMQPLQVPPWYFPLSGAAWMVAGAAAWLWLLTEQRWARYALALTVTAFAAVWWVDHEMLPQAAFYHHNWAFLALLWGMLLTATLLLTLSPAWYSLLGEDNEQSTQSEDRATP